MGCHDDDSEINLQVDFESFIFLEIIAKALANSIWQVTTFCKNVFPKPTHNCNMIFLLKPDCPVRGGTWILSTYAK